MTEEAPIVEQLSEQEKADRMHEYQVTMNKCMGQCAGTRPQVAVAALMSAAANILVDNVENADRARGYFQMVVNDIMHSFEKAYETKNTPIAEMIGETGATPVEEADGSIDAGERSKA